MELEHVKGLDALSRALKSLPDRIAKAALRQSVARAAALVRDEAKQRAPVAAGAVRAGDPLPGTLKRAIVTKHDIKRSSLYSQTYAVTVRHGIRYRNQGKHGHRSQDAYYWRWVEFGTVKMMARPFLRPAFETKKSEAVATIAETLKARIKEESARLGARGA